MNKRRGRGGRGGGVPRDGGGDTHSEDYCQTDSLGTSKAGGPEDVNGNTNEEAIAKNVDCIHYQSFGLKIGGEKITHKQVESWRRQYQANTAVSAIPSTPADSDIPRTAES